MSLIHSFHANFIFAEIGAILAAIFLRNPIVSMTVPMVVAVVVAGMAIVMTMALLSEQSMRVRVTAMQDHIHENIDGEPGNGRNEHDGGVLDEVAGEDPLGGLVDDEDNQQPDDEEIGQCPQQFHAVVAERHPLVHSFLGEVEEHEGEDEADQIAHQVDGVRNDGDGTRNFATDYLARDEDQGDGDDRSQSAVVFGTVLRRGRGVERTHLLTVADLFHLNSIQVKKLPQS